MFSGLVEDIGTVVALREVDGTSTELEIKVQKDLLSDASLGDSIAINGTCLTVTWMNAERNAFKVGVSPQTLRVTCLGTLKCGDRVNLEPSLTLQKRIGGHYVQGHVDTTVKLAEKRPEKDSLWLRFVFNSEAEFLKFGRYVVEKGYVAIDGTSLTVANLTDDGFEIMLVKYTQENVALGDKNVGDAFNLEVDILSKTMERLLSFDAMKAKLQAK